MDECNLGSHDCGQLYHCRNTQGSYRCDAKTCAASEVMNPETGECISVHCPPGYAARNGTCEDEDECARGRVCGAYEDCINTPGSFRCQERGNLCAPGYRMDKESGFCLGGCSGWVLTGIWPKSFPPPLPEHVLGPAPPIHGSVADLDECATDLHTCGSLQCINLPGAFKCRCSAGFEFNETSKQCEDVDECSKFEGHLCSQHAVCVNSVGSFQCLCNAGFQLSADGRHCEGECAH